VSSSQPPILGVTGPVAAGKSALSRRLAALGARVIDVDGLGHAALAERAVRDAVVAAFGEGVRRGKSGPLDPRALARIVFDDDAARRRLEAIVHPVVRKRIDEEIRRAQDDGAPLVVVDCALLFESGLDAVCDSTVDVDAPESERLARAARAHGWDAEETRRRAGAQWSAAEKRRRADRVVVNDGDESRLAVEAEHIWNEALSGVRAGRARRTNS